MKVEMQLGSEKLSIEMGKVAKQADGAVWVQYGGTVVLVTVVADNSENDLDFFPLTVDYRERAYAAGRIPTVYGKREPRRILKLKYKYYVQSCLQMVFIQLMFQH